MPVRPLKQSDSFTGFTSTRTDSKNLAQNVFFISNGIRKRKIYYNVDYTELEERWINTVRKELKKEKNIEIEEDQTILRYYYSADLVLEKCLERLVKYHEWFTSPEIQIVTDKTNQIFKEGFIYSYGKAIDGRPFVIMNLGIFNLDKHDLINYYQAMNQVLNRVIKEQFVPGYIQNYYFILDLDQKLLSLPLSSLGDIIKVIANAYSMFLQKMMVVNCTTLSKWIYNRLTGFIAEETVRKITLYTKEDVEQGQLKEFIDGDILEKKYGGYKSDINHLKQFKDKERMNRLPDELSQTEYFSIEQNEDYFNNSNQSPCCSVSQQCDIY